MFKDHSTSCRCCTEILDSLSHHHGQVEGSPIGVGSLMVCVKQKVVHKDRHPLSGPEGDHASHPEILRRGLVISHHDIEVGSQHSEGVPQFINAPVREDPDRYNVEFWRPSWQRIISGDTKSYVYGLIAQGFDGAVISGVEAFKFFEGGGEEETEEGN